MIQWCWLGKEAKTYFHEKATQLGGIRTEEGGPRVKELVGPNDIGCYGWQFPNEQSLELFREYARKTDHGISDEETLQIYINTQ